MKRILSATLAFFIALSLIAQDHFHYRLELEPLGVSGLPGLHSFACAQDNGKWLLIGGRKDGLHPRQPFNSFPSNQNNQDIYVVDPVAGQSWSVSVNSLPAGLNEQLQSTNMNFYQEEDTLYIIGGYAFSASANDHITFDKLTTVRVSGLINAIVNNQSITPYFKQIADPNFAVCGGQLTKLDDTFMLVGGQRFDGRYNPMGHATYTQTYTNAIRKFKIDNSGSQLSFNHFSQVTDGVHLHRRDYNLVPQILPDGTMGFLISSGVFQTNVDLPYLYPVEIRDSIHTPIGGFSQYLSNYHSAKAALFDSLNNEMHAIFFGGMSQYYYQNGNLIQDNQVPFVKTISRLTRYSDGSLTEYKMSKEMPGLKGSSAEFIPNENLPHYENDILKLHAFTGDTLEIGHIVGGILSSSLNPFSVNQTNLTSADNSVYKVLLIRDLTSSSEAVIADNPYDVKIFPNPAGDTFNIEISGKAGAEVRYSITKPNGQLLDEGSLKKASSSTLRHKVDTNFKVPCRAVIISVTIDNRYTFSEKLFID